MADITEQVNQLYIKEYLPAIIVVTIVIIVGLVGNTFAVIYYGWKAQKAVVQILILALSINDLVTNIALIQDVADFCFTVTYRSAAACKIFFFLKHWLVGNSLLLMVAMAMDRYRRVCFPFSTQFTQQSAKYLILGFSSFSLLLSVRYFGTADIVRNNLTLEVNATKGHYCGLSDTEVMQVIEKNFHWIDICVHALIIISLIVFYSLVVRKVVLSKRKLKSHDKISILNSRKGSNAAHTECSTSGVVETNLSNTHYGSSGQHVEHTTAANNSNTISKPEVSIENHSGVSDNTLSYRISHFFQKPKIKHHMSASAKAEMKITVMVAMITLASVLCFVPYYLSMMLISSNMSGDGLILSVGNVLLRRTYMLNSAINPFIMAFYNEPFRRFIKQKLTCTCKKVK